MRKFLVVTLFTVALFSFVKCDGIDPEYLAGLDSRLSALEGTRIATVEQQVQSIQASIEALVEMDNTLKGYIEALQQKDLPELQAAIEALQQKDVEIEQAIAMLQTYVGEQITSTKEWVTATFCTLEQYQGLVNLIASLEQDLSTYKESTNEKMIALETAIGTLETTLKNWVNEALTGYYDIAAIDAKVTALENAIQEGDEANQKAIKDVKDSLVAAVADLTAAYQKAISEAIETNNGVINNKIAQEIEAVNTRITQEVASLTTRIDDLESRIQAIEEYINSQKNFTIDFDITEDMVCFPGATVSIPFTISESTLPTTVECVPDPGWKADVALDGNKGIIKVTAPEVGGNGKILVFANRSTWTIMRALYFDEGILRIVNKEFKMPWTGGEIEANVTTNMDYVIEYSGNQDEWITLQPTTKAECRNDLLVFTVAENGEDLPDRTGFVYLKNANGDVLASFAIIQAHQPTNNPIVFADPVAKIACVAKFDTNGDGELSYKEADAVASLSGVFDEYRTITSFDELQYFTSITTLESVFYGCSNLVSVAIPDNVVELGKSAFNGCKSLKKVVLPDSITTISQSAFAYAGIESFTFPPMTSSIEQSAFYASMVKHISIPEGVKSIPKWAFWECNNLREVVLPNSLESIGERAFKNTVVLKFVVPENVTTIGEEAFTSWGIIPRTIILKGAVLPTFQSQFDNAAVFVNDDLLAEASYRTGWSSYSPLYGINTYKDSPYLEKTDNGIKIVAIHGLLEYAMKYVDPGDSKPAYYIGESYIPNRSCLYALGVRESYIYDDQTYFDYITSEDAEKLIVCLNRLFVNCHFSVATDTEKDCAGYTNYYSNQIYILVPASDIML